jgi:hypothetical protein
MGSDRDIRESDPKGLTLWAWLRSALPSQDCSVENQCGGRDSSSVATAASLIPAASGKAQDTGSTTAQPEGKSSPASVGVILPFPIHGEALLVKLAEVLRNRIADRGPVSDPLLLTMSRCPRSRLSIDRAAHVEFHQDRSEYRAVIEASRETKIILETADFDTLVDVVVLYVVERLAEPAALDAAS